MIFNALILFSFVPSEEIRKQSDKKPLKVEITRDVKKLAPSVALHGSKFVIYDSIESFSSDDW